MRLCWHAEIEFGMPGTVTDVTESCSKAYLLVSPQTGIALPITQFAIFMFLLHKSLGEKHIYTVKKAEDQ
jgi:hypothetical protein